MNRNLSWKVINMFSNLKKLEVNNPQEYITNLWYIVCICSVFSYA